MVNKQATADSLAHDAHPGHVLFEEQNDILWLRGKHLAMVSQTLGLQTSASSLGFDYTTFALYVNQLSEKGVKVGLIEGNTVRIVEPQRPTRLHQVPKYTSIGLSPQLIVGRRELDRLLQSARRKQPFFKDLVAHVRETLADDQAGTVSEYGALYVFQVAPDIYEVDEELTTMLKDVREALMLAVHLSGKLLSCRLVLPKPKRGKKRDITATPLLKISEPFKYGQLSFNL